MRIDVLTIFPSLFDSFLSESLLKKAIDKKTVEIRIHDIRKFSDDKHKKVDDAPFGGGAGMVMTPQPIADAIESVKNEEEAKVVLLSPRGKVFNQRLANEYSALKRLVLVCGRYEGVDERIAEHFADEEISVGDFILNGGEVSAMAVIEAVFRLLPGAVGNEESVKKESFENGLLEYPQYTRPENFRGHAVPQVLLSGHHENVEKWRMEKALEKTCVVRPDMMKQIGVRKKIKFSIALVHHPVEGKSGEEIVGSVTTLDVHDMARIGKTFGAEGVFIVTPVEDQKRLVGRIKEHWASDDLLKETGGRRKEALEILKVVSSVEEVVEAVKGKRIKLLATSAVDSENAIGPDEWKRRADEADEWIILFGTAYGLAKSVIEKADYRLKPVTGKGEYNHLPVRAASAIILDRLIGSIEEIPE